MIQDLQVELIARIQKIFPMSEEEKNLFSDRIIVKKYQKGDLLMVEGQVLDREFFVIDGLLRQYTLTDGKDKSVFFYLKNQIVRLSGKGIETEKSAYYLECLEDSTICVAYSRPDDEEFIQKYPRFLKLCFILTEDIFKHSQDILEDFIHLNPLERYQMLIEKRPELIQRVSQQHLASYLGFTPESLSRIRKRMADNRKLNLAKP